MELSYMPHHGQDAEHSFDEEKWKKEIKKAIEKARKEGYKRGVLDERKRAREEKRKRNKQRIEAALLLVVITVVAEFVYTFITQQFKLIVAGGFWTALLAGVAYIIKTCSGDKELLKDTRGNKSALQSFFSGIQEFWKDIRRNNKLFFMFIICLGGLLGGGLGQFEVVSRSVSGFKGFGEAWVNYESKKIEENNDGEAGEEPALMNESTEDKASEELNDSDGSDGNSDIAAFIEDSDYDVDDLRQIEISDIELDHIVDLSAEDYEFVFFTGEEYAIEDWENQEEIDDVVLRMIKDLRREKKVNLFDEGIAPQDVQNEIDYASADEKKAKSFMEIERIQQVRVDVYRDYPKKSIANLIANSEQLKALVLYYYQGSQQSILYHYGKSILWEGEYLKYKDVSNDEVNKHLSKIAQRYGDVAFTCKDCTDSTRASKLQTAYENAAKWYRGVTDEED